MTCPSFTCPLLKLSTFLPDEKLKMVKKMVEKQFAVVSLIKEMNNIKTDNVMNY